MKKLPHKVLILGSGALKIGEAGEFDYSGSQAIKALQQEKIATVVLNPNIATIQTSDYLADRVYFQPLEASFAVRVIARERPDGILIGFGGQSALNCGLALHRQGILERYAVSVLGTPLAAVEDTEDRQRFRQRLAEIGVPTPHGRTATQLAHTREIAAQLGYPLMLRSAYALGGLGSGLCRNAAELEVKAAQALAHCPQILLEESLEGWKEIEYEVLRDAFDNCIAVCNMENLDPLGIHTGESIVVAPSQTLSNEEYYQLRSVALQVVRHLGIVGECNIQFALSPQGRYRVIEVNARLSRSSALASKATGYPLAFVAAKLALGYGLHQLPNAMTQATRAFCEPALDYIVVKAPRWDLRKFRGVEPTIGSSMKSVGEVMAIGRSFEEALQKALRMLGTGADGLVANPGLEWADLEKQLNSPTEDRIFVLAAALQAGYAQEAIHQLTRIDPWFIAKIAYIVRLAGQLEQGNWSPDTVLEAKQAGFSDQQLATLSQQPLAAIRAFRQEHGIHPWLRQIDTLAGEYPARSNYLYLSYHGMADDLELPAGEAILLLGSGAYHIGSSVEFDWCCVNAGLTLRRLGYRTVMLNCNPATVSTDYDECDFLVFDEIAEESILEICRKGMPAGLVISMGGQLPNQLAVPLARAGLPVLGTAAGNIDAAEDRSQFSHLLNRLGIDQPPWRAAPTLAAALAFAAEVGYPVLIRPSYVLSGAAMAVADNAASLGIYLARAARVSPQYPVVISQFLENAQEIELDGVAARGHIVIHAISEHIERAGIHSGDATLVLPPQQTPPAIQARIRDIAGRIAQALEIHGPFNIQFLVQAGQVKVIECNLRASRSFPFVSKVLGRNLSEIGTAVLVDRLSEVPPPGPLPYLAVKMAQFSFPRLQGADPVSGVEMASTGEIACFGNSLGEALLKACLAVGYPAAFQAVLLSTGPPAVKEDMLESILLLHQRGIRLYATAGTAAHLQQHGLAVAILHWPLESRQPNALAYLKTGRIDLVLNIPKNYREEELSNDYLIRRTAVDCNIPLLTDAALARQYIAAWAAFSPEQLDVASWQEYMARLAK